MAERAGFRARDIQVMDGSKRSRHSNAFFTGLGRFRKIVLFDTLMQQLDQPELESVLAHEIGHYKKGHILKTMALYFPRKSGHSIKLFIYRLIVLQIPQEICNRERCGAVVGYKRLRCIRRGPTLLGAGWGRFLDGSILF